MRTLPMKQALLTAAALGFLILPVAAQTDAAKAPAPAPSAAAPAPSADALPPKHVSWSFNGPFGTYDRAALQRGFQVYKEVCSACHSLSLVAIRNLADRGGPEFTEAQMNGALPPDLSLIIKAREGHEDYVYSILTSFGPPPPNSKMAPGMNYNPMFPGRQIAMPPPLSTGSVTYADGTPNTIDQEARDVVTFLSWASEPKMEERKRTGFNVMIFLIGFTTLLFFSYRRVWHGHH